MGKKGIAHRRFSKEEKLKIIKEHLEEHESIMALEKKYSVGNSTISRWVQVYREEGEDALEPHNGNSYAVLHTSKHLSEIERLRLPCSFVPYIFKPVTVFPVSKVSPIA